MSYYTPSQKLAYSPQLVYSDQVYSSQYNHPSTHVPPRYLGDYQITPSKVVLYQNPVSLRQESPVFEQTAPYTQQLSYSQIIPQTVQTGYQPVYQADYDRKLEARDSSPLSTQNSQVIYQAQKPSESYYVGTQSKFYTPIHKDQHERLSEEEYIYQSEKQREIDYLNWKASSMRSRSPQHSTTLVSPPRPLVPLASSYVLQPGQYSDIKHNITNYENNLVANLNTEEKFRQMKEEMNKCSYTYSQMINTILYNFKEILQSLKEIEKCKNDLINKEDFSIQVFYNILNNDKNNPLSAEQLKLSLTDLNFSSIDVYDIELLFAKYSNERSSEYLTLNDFKKLFIPYYVNSRRKYEFESRQEQQEVSIETQRIAARVIKMHLSLENSQEYYRQLMSKRLIDLAYCFDYIDRDRKGVLNYSQIQTFLQGNDIYFNQEDVNLLIQRFNNAYPIGPQLDHIIKLNEFIYELSPKSRIPYLKE
ncbi:EF hand protein, putative (macronuclear) [Tetrahymena thermophila SB210]|uniref:EF hand protein, putative n=1 Tax=Tetrahymena thermophila (strain SB210) TaxID=312017 RepID=W7X447_TETTS|nr:EF hand protein, putative [Tetrahymena thermophila SB210]EWS72207.1 EF hand protein, putative [Tetrahymena thermophila SB210]|eukprot:XP_012655250.1 EF hand protein, putative [Tetrahymena thermophila SB210]